MKRSSVLMLLCLGLSAPAWAEDKPATPAKSAPKKTAKQVPEKSAKQAPDAPVKPASVVDKEKPSRITMPLAPTPEELLRQRQAQKAAADAREDPNRQGRGRFPTQVRNTYGSGSSVGANSNQARKDALIDSSGQSGARTPIP